MGARGPERLRNRSLDSFAELVVEGNSTISANTVTAGNELSAHWRQNEIGPTTDPVLGDQSKIREFSTMLKHRRGGHIQRPGKFAKTHRGFPD